MAEQSALLLTGSHSSTATLLHTWFLFNQEFIRAHTFIYSFALASQLIRAYSGSHLFVCGSYLMHHISLRRGHKCFQLELSWNAIQAHPFITVPHRHSRSSCLHYANRTISKYVPLSEACYRTRNSSFAGP